MDLTLLLQNSHTPIFKNKKQWVRVSNKFGVFEEIISRFSQGSIVGQIWLVLFLTTFFYLIENASVHNFEDDETLFH